MEQYLLQLMLSPWIGYSAIKRILAYASDSSQLSLEFLCDNPKEFTSIVKVNNDTIASIYKNKESAKRLEEELTGRKYSSLAL